MWTKEKVKLQIEHIGDYELKEILSWLLLRVEELEAAQPSVQLTGRTCPECSGVDGYHKTGCSMWLWEPPRN